MLCGLITWPTLNPQFLIAGSIELSLRFEMSRTNFYQGRSPSRNFDIISNCEFIAAPDTASLPKITCRKDTLKSCSPSLHSTLNRSNYDFNIISQRALGASLRAQEPVKIGNKRVYLASKFAQESDVSSTRFREKYGQYAGNKHFNRKKGLVKEFWGNEVNTVTDWLKRQ